MKWTGQKQKCPGYGRFHKHKHECQIPFSSLSLSVSQSVCLTLNYVTLTQFASLRNKSRKHSDVFIGGVYSISSTVTPHTYAQALKRTHAGDLPLMLDGLDWVGQAHTLSLTHSGSHTQSHTLRLTHSVSHTL